MRSLKTLIVDDDRDLADSLAILLELEGHRVALAYDARHAFSNPGEAAFDIVLMDIQLPDRSGLDPTNLADGLTEAGHRVPIVVSGRSRDEVAEAEGRFGLPVTACFAAVRDETHVLQRIEKVRES